MPFAACLPHFSVSVCICSVSFQRNNNAAIIYGDKLGSSSAFGFKKKKKKTLLNSVVLHEVSEFSVCVASVKQLTFSLSHRALILPSVFAPSQTNCSFHTYDALDDKPDASSHAQPA